jgi:transposase-like protein
MQKRQKIGSYPAEFRERAVRLVQESEASYPSRWAALLSVSGKVGCSAEILRGWLKAAEGQVTRHTAPVVDSETRIAALEREVHELRQANEILRKASAYFAQAELDRPWRK